MLCRPTNDVTVVALLPLAFVLVELPRRSSLALAIPCLLAFVLAANLAHESLKNIGAVVRIRALRISLAHVCEELWMLRTVPPAEPLDPWM